MNNATIDSLAEQLAEGLVVPYLGPGLFPADAPIPTTPAALCTRLEAKVTVPQRARGHLPAAAQYIESNRHRRVLTGILEEAFAPMPAPTAAHRWVARLPWRPLVVDTWYDDTTLRALAAEGRPLCQVTGMSRVGQVTDWFRHDGCSAGCGASETLLYKPHGSVRPNPEFLISDADYVEVLTEIDIQTPIPPAVRELRRGRGFLFLGCRFMRQMDRIFAMQVMKRSADRHWAVIPEAPSRNEARFLKRYGIARIDLPVDAVIEALEARLPVSR
ncbi:MAG: SIR2 family protein [Nitrospirae bacterium]|nr:SIR2 family protein [Nitrospirota bacterium]